MDTIYLVLTLLFVASATGIAARFVPSLPTPLVQIAFGALLAWPAQGIHVTLEPELFLLLFIAPLLFSDARRFPQRELLALRKQIVALALGLVLFTVLIVGFLINWLIPQISLPIAFALAAVLSPTDAVAVSAISGKLPVPPRLLHMLEGESLMNDASGLVAFNFAVAAALTGVFSIKAVALSFVFIAFGGFILGALIAWLFSILRTQLIDRHGGENSVTQIVLLQLLLPFAVYFLAEHFGMSGILAAVSAGLVVNATDLKRQDQIQTRLKTRSMWETIEFVLNSLVFLLLGFQLPHILGGAFADPIKHGEYMVLVKLCLIGLIITLALLAMRFIWVSSAVFIANIVNRFRKKGKSRRPYSLRLVLTATLAGIRGTITLAAALSFPQTLANGSPFPARDLLIFIATCVILLTLLSGSIGIPWLLNGLDLPKDNSHDDEEAWARKCAAEAAIRRIEACRHNWVEKVHAEQSALENGDEQESQAETQQDNRIVVYAEQSTQILNAYRDRISEGSTEAGEQLSRLQRQVWQALVRQALHAERAEYYRLRNHNKINDELLNSLVRELDLRETGLLAGAEQVD